jgi:hypothetical protein
MGKGWSMGHNDTERSNIKKVEAADYPPMLRELAEIPYIRRLVPLFVPMVIATSALIFLSTLLSLQSNSAYYDTANLFLSFSFFCVALIVRRVTRRNARLRRERLEKLRADSLPERAARASQVLRDAITLVTEQAEM